MLLKRDLKLIHCFLFSFFFSFISILLFVFISGSPIKNEFIYNQLTDWAKTGYFSTYDFRNYFVGIVVFGLSPFLIYLLTPKLNRFWKILQKYRIIIISLMLIFGFLFIRTSIETIQFNPSFRAKGEKSSTIVRLRHIRRGFAGFLSRPDVMSGLLRNDKGDFDTSSSKLIFSRYKEFLSLLNSKKRGQKLLQNIIYMPIIISLFLTIYFFIKLKLFRQCRNIQAILKACLKSLSLLSLRSRVRLGRSNPVIRTGSPRSFLVRDDMLPEFFKHVLIDFIVLGLIFFLIFNPEYKYSYQQLINYGGEAGHEFHHTNFYLGPINEVLNGKSLLVNANSQYGLLTIYIPTLIFHFLRISYANFTLYNMLLSVLYAYLLYIFFKIITKSRTWSLLGILIFIKIIFFRYDPQNEIYIFPSSTPLRYFFDVLSLLAIYSLYQSFSLKKSFVTGIIVSLAFYYNFEIGFPIFTAYVATIILDFFMRPYYKTSLSSPTRSGIFEIPTGAYPVDSRFRGNDIRGGMTKRVFSTDFSLLNILFLFLSILSLGLIISLTTYLRSGFYPNWYLMMAPILFFTRGFFDIPMPIMGAYYIPLAVYILTFYIILFKLFKRNYDYIHILCFLLIYGISNFIYYLGFNVPDHLLTVIHPSVILMFIYVWWVYKNKNLFNSLAAIYKSIFITLMIVYLSFSIWPPNELWQNTWGKIYRRYNKLPQKYYKWDYSGTDIYLADDDGKNFLKAADVIRKYANDKKDVLIISRYDTLLLVMTQKTSLVNYSILEYEITYKTDLEKTINKIKMLKPKFIFVFSEEYNRMSNDNLIKIWTGIKNNYSFIENGGVVDVYRYR